jgi:hypothetical protein
MTYKELIFNSIGDKLDEAKIKEIYFSYDIKTAQAKVFVACYDDKNEDISNQITKSEISKIRFLFINKVVRALKKLQPDKELMNLIVKIDVSKKDLEIFGEFFISINQDNEIIKL